MLNHLKRQHARTKKHIRVKRGRAGFQPKKTKESLFWRAKANQSLGILLNPNPQKKDLKSLIKTKITKKNIIKYFYRRMNAKMVKNSNYTLSGIINKNTAGAIKSITNEANFADENTFQGDYTISADFD